MGQLEEQRKYAQGIDKHHNLSHPSEPPHSSLIQEHLQGCFKNTEILDAVLNKLDGGHDNTASRSGDEPQCPGLLPLIVYQLRELRLRLDRLVSMTARY